MSELVAIARPAEIAALAANESKVSRPEVRRAYAELRGLVTRRPGMGDPELVLATLLEVGYGIAAGQRHEIELVWTGPASVERPVRSTAQVLQELIADSRRFIVLVGYRLTAGSAVVPLIESLAHATHRGVHVTMIVDEDGANREAVSRGDWAQYNRPRFLTWRLGREGFAKLHAKVTVVDDERALLTSANPTLHGLQENIELGVLLSGHISVEIRQRFSALERVGVLEDYEL